MMAPDSAAMISGMGKWPSGVPVVATVVKAPMPMKAAPPMDTWPARPMSQSWPIAAIA
jgi:hypothetical protein